MLIFLLFFTSNLYAQTVHVHKLNPNLDIKETRGVRVHDNSDSLLKAQLDFQARVFKGAGVSEKVAALNFEEKEDLLKFLEEQDKEKFLKQYPQFNATEVLAMRKAMYD